MASYWTNWRDVRAEMAGLDHDYEERRKSEEEDVSMAESISNTSFDEIDVSIDDNFDCEQLNNSSSETSEGENLVNELSDDLCEWATKHKLTRAAFNDLLSLMRKHGHDLPKDSRTLLNTLSRVDTVAKCGGRYIYFGIEKSIRQVLKSNFRIDQIPDTIPLVFNIDG